MGITNSKKQRTVGTIELRLEKRVRYYFMSLSTGKHLHDFIWTGIPINDQVIYRVNDLATKEKQPGVTKGYPIFEWSLGIP